MFKSKYDLLFLSDRFKNASRLLTMQPTEICLEDNKNSMSVSPLSELLNKWPTFHDMRCKWPYNAIPPTGRAASWIWFSTAAAETTTRLRRRNCCVISCGTNNFSSSLWYVIVGTNDSCTAWGCALTQMTPDPSFLCAYVLYVLFSLILQQLLFVSTCRLLNNRWFS